MQKGTVLVVDDDPGIMELVTDALEDEGYLVLQAVDGAALKVAQEKHPDVLLLDVNMPGINGIEISKRLRSAVDTACIPIVGMTAMMARAQQEGMVADDWLAKPFNLQRLYQVVARWTSES